MFSTAKGLSVCLLVVWSLHLVSAVISTRGYIIHESSGKIIHPLNGSPLVADNTKLVVFEGGLGEYRLLLHFEEDPTQFGYGYIKHVLSGKYVHPLGGSLQPGDNTPLVFYIGKHAACLFRFDTNLNYIMHRSSLKVWHPLGGLSNPNDNTEVVLHQDKHDRAKFYFGSNQGTKIYYIVPPIGYVTHYSSGKIIHPLNGSPQPADNTNLVVYTGGYGELRLQLQFVEDPNTEGYGYIKHTSSGKYVHPYGGSLQPADNTPLVFYTGHHAACLFRFDECEDYIVHESSNKIWHPLGGSENPADNTVVVLHIHQHDRAKFFFANSYGVKISPH